MAEENPIEKILNMPGNCLMTRRQFLKGMGAATSTILLSDIFLHPLLGRAAFVTQDYPRKKIGGLSLQERPAP